MTARAGVSLLLVGGITAICWAIHVNATAAALALLLCVLGAATVSGLADAILTSVAAVLALNYFFLPPVGTLNIADPGNWVALFAFLVTAVTASQLSARAQQRAREALMRKQESEKLYNFSRALLTEESVEVQFGLREAARIFELTRIAYYDRAHDEVLASPVSDVTAPLRRMLAEVAESEEPRTEGSLTLLPVRLGRAAIGSLAIEGDDLTKEVRESIATLIAINQERVQTLERIAAAEAARKNEQLKSTLLDGLAHDLNTPLSAIKTSVTTLLTHEFRTDANRNELLAIIEEETDRLHRVIGEALMLARVESDKVNLDRTPIAAAELMARAVQGCRADPERIVIESPEGFVVDVDGELFSLALRQLIENAGRYSPHHSPIEVSSRYDPPTASFVVRDHGDGIKHGEREKIFERYHRGSAGQRTKVGTGMGLAIARAIVEAHGGKIWADNAAGGGAQFTILLSDAAKASTT
jgi:two-component system sensor histidine kinase KdpD